MNNQKKKNPLLLIAIVLVLFLGLTFVGRKILTRGQDGGANAGIISLEVGKTFEFVGRDPDGVPLNQTLSLTFTHASKQSEVIIQGKSATAKNDKIFLVLDLKVTNTTTLPYYLLPVDLVRLADGEERIAPSVHQGRLEIRPISTKESNLGFVVDQKQNEFKFEVGEIENEKQEFTIRFWKGVK